jgi:hypothetical protein
MFSINWRWVVSFTPRPLYPRVKSPQYTLDRRLGGHQNLSERHGEKKNLAPTGTRTPTPRPSCWKKRSWPILRYYFNIYPKRLNGFFLSVLRLIFFMNFSLFPWALHVPPLLFPLTRSTVDKEYSYEAPYYALFFGFPVLPLSVSLLSPCYSSNLRDPFYTYTKWVVILKLCVFWSLSSDRLDGKIKDSEVNGGTHSSDFICS